MSVATELTKLNTNIKNAYDEISAKGGTVPQNKNTDNLATAISSIPSGGGSADDYFYTSGELGSYNDMIKKIPDFSTTKTSINSFFSSTKAIEVGNVSAPNATSCANMFMSAKVEYIGDLYLPLCTNIQGIFSYANRIKSIGTLTLGNVTSCFQSFQSCSLKTYPYINTQNCTTFYSMFYGSSVENVPVYNTSSATNLSDMFRNCYNLTDQSLDNILQMCIGATSFTGTKDLRNTIRLHSNYYSDAKIQSLPHYQDFINAGWTI